LDHEHGARRPGLELSGHAGAGGALRARRPRRRRGRRRDRSPRSTRGTACQRGELHDGVPQLHRHDRCQHPGKGRRLRSRGGESRSVKVGVVGAAGYAGGELLRLLLGHPKVDEIVAGSESLAGKPIISAHPNLRKRTSLTFVHYEDVSRCDVLFLALPNGAHRAHEFEDRATVLIDLSSDHRLRDPADYDRWYGSPHPRPALLDRWTYGRVDRSVTPVELVRGVLATAHAYTAAPVDEKALWKIYRDAYAAEPFVRIVKERTGIWRYPEPKLVAGTNFADVGFALDPRAERVVALCAIDNLMKGAAGNGVQAMNVACGYAEDAGLGFMGLHP